MEPDLYEDIFQSLGLDIAPGNAGHLKHLAVWLGVVVLTTIIVCEICLGGSGRDVRCQSRDQETARIGMSYILSSAAENIIPAGREKL